MSIQHVYVGYDAREHAAWQACWQSLRDTSPHVGVTALRHRDLRTRGLLRREWRVDAAGQYHDAADGRPFSTEFSHSRFLAPHLARQQGRTGGWVLFCDCDFLFRRDLRELNAFLDRRSAVACVKHNYGRRPDGVKMDGVAQQNYRRKLWSSLLAFNLDHQANAALTVDACNEQTGAWLHALRWLEDGEIAALPPDWNWIPDLSPYHEDPSAVHFSFDAIWFGHSQERLRIPHTGEWLTTYRRFLTRQADRATHAPVSGLFFPPWVTDERRADRA